MSEEITLEQLRLLKNAKGKLVSVRVSVNDWLVQVIVDDQWTTVYHQKPPTGLPETIADSVESARQLAITRAYRRFTQTVS